MRRTWLLLAALALIAPARAEHIKIGAIKTTSAGPLYLAIERGYFKAAGIDAELVFFDAAQPIAVAVVSGGIEVGASGLTAGLYNLAGQGALRIVAGQGHEAPGFHALAFFEAKQAYAAGLKSLDGLAGHSAGLTGQGTPAHYAMGVIAEKHGVALSSIKVMPLGSVPNIVSALTGGQVDVGVTVLTVPMMPQIERGDLRVLAWIGDELAMQDRATFVSTRMADEQHDLIARFLAAYRKGAQDYHDALIGPDERPQDGPGAAEVIGLIAKYTGQPPEAVKLGIAYVEPMLRLNVADVLRQIAWYKAQGMVKPEVEGNAFIDKRYVVPLPN
jgi:NitT/TauT family transport system substrate-binding protein